MKKAKLSANYESLCYKDKEGHIIGSTKDIREIWAEFFEELLQGNSNDILMI